MDTFNSLMMTILRTTTRAMPNQGLKKGKKAMELNKIASIQLIGVKLNNSSIATDRQKCSNTIKKVAWIKSVIEVISYCLFCENTDLNTPSEE